MGLRLQADESAIHDVEMSRVIEIGIAAQRKDPIAGIEGAIRVGPFRGGVESEAVGSTIARANDAAGDADLAAARALPGHAELIVDRLGRRRGRSSSVTVDTDREHRTESEFGGAEGRARAKHGGELVCISLTETARDSGGVAAGSGA